MPASRFFFIENEIHRNENCPLHYQLDHLHVQFPVGRNLQTLSFRVKREKRNMSSANSTKLGVVRVSIFRYEKTMILLAARLKKHSAF